VKNKTLIKILGLFAAICLVPVLWIAANAFVPKGQQWAPPKEWKGSPAPWNAPRGFGGAATPWAPPKGFKPMKEAWKPPKGLGQPTKPWDAPKVEPVPGTAVPAAPPAPAPVVAPPPYQEPVKTPEKNIVPIDKDRINYPDDGKTITL
jgi:hypothetical protein